MEVRACCCSRQTIPKQRKLRMFKRGQHLTASEYRTVQFKQHISFELL